MIIYCTMIQALFPQGKKNSHILNKVISFDYTENESCHGSDAPQYEILKKTSPMTLILEKFHRRGEHRGSGDIFKSLMSMQKMNIFHEVTSSLPEEDRLILGETIHQMQVARNRRSQAKKWSNTLPHIQRQTTFSSSDTQKYTPMEESAGVVENAGKNIKEPFQSNTLIQDCRALRLREDNIFVPFQNDLKIKALLRKSESFKY